MLIHPRDFQAEYVDPAIGIFGEQMLAKHLAVHAVSQMDNLAEVVAVFTRADETGKLPWGEAKRYREELRKREPVLGIIHDAHDCHKHGKLNRKSAVEDERGMATGQRPEQIEALAFFCGVTECGGPLTPYDALAITLNDGTQEVVFDLLVEGLRAWKREFDRLGL